MIALEIWIIYDFTWLAGLIQGNYINFLQQVHIHFHSWRLASTGQFSETTSFDLVPYIYQ